MAQVEVVADRRASIARTSFQWFGMITKKTFPTIIVPTIAPTRRYEARAANRWYAPHAPRQTAPKTSAARIPSSFANARHKPS